MLTIGVLVSGVLGFETLCKLAEVHPIKFILTDSNSNTIIDFAHKHKIPLYAGNPRGGSGHNFIKKINVDVIISINYLFLIERDIFNHSNILTFNIHGSLLPKYRGRTPHVWAIINGETMTGITAHIIDNGCDTGKIIRQIKIAIGEEDTGAVILTKYSKEYFPLIEKVLSDIISNKISLREQDESKATIFGKRTPLDGEINWNWNKEKIRNWIRAQANPYPGAFTFFQGQKIIIDKASISKVNTFDNQKNGQIINTSPNVVVKVRDGSLNLDVIRTQNCTFIKGNIFSNENRK
ncbi:formyltransferase family protein [Maribacter sp. BPC-D8]|uniref:methionyl-tRNA formyltransferase n=1 Tax=Maribacter sp. BPC-D8 TaxID=3053613 RepID=UPI002B4663E8|nr:formyltransferase family protein [Maribacter sp. BPC-D8]WRI28717.1 formyltransferase family protein [Maribacter sp. BPC-D8]